MTPKCNLRNFEFQGLGRRSVVGRFDGGKITSDTGGLLLREVERRTRMMRYFEKCFRDERKEKWLNTAWGDWSASVFTGWRCLRPNAIRFDSSG